MFTSPDMRTNFFNDEPRGDEENEPAVGSAVSEYEFKSITGVSRKECDLMLLSFMLKYKMPYEGVTALTALMHATHPAAKAKNIYAGSVSRIREMYAKDVEVKKEYYCSICCDYLDSGSKCTKDQCTKKKSTVSSYISVSLEDQLKQIFRRKKVRDWVLKRHETQSKKIEGNIETIADGSVYKFCSEFLCQPNSFSFGFYTDGFNVFNSAKGSFWPLMFRIN